MFDFAWSEIALIGIVGLIFIGPKDMPTAIRAVTDILKKGRKLAGEFQTHVDEMVREADLGEARDSLRQLRSMNIRGQVMKALDSDGSLRRTLSENPLSPVPAASSSAIPGAAPEILPSNEAAASVEEMLERRNAPHFVPHSFAQTGSDSVPDLGDIPDSDDPAPGIIPPSTARRLRRLRAAPAPPAFLPPGAIRPHTDLY
jgi:sec-independent protein translocase protein TatB